MQPVPAIPPLTGQGQSSLPAVPAAQTEVQRFEMLLHRSPASPANYVASVLPPASLADSIAEGIFEFGRSASLDYNHKLTKVFDEMARIDITSPDAMLQLANLEMHSAASHIHNNLVVHTVKEASQSFKTLYRLEG